jgi:hypothetical protein
MGGTSWIEQSRLKFRRGKYGKHTNGLKPTEERQASIADRIAETVVKRYLEPLVEPCFHEDSYGYSPGKSALNAAAWRGRDAGVTRGYWQAQSLGRSSTSCLPAPGRFDHGWVAQSYR